MTGGVEKERGADTPREALRARIRRLERAGMVLVLALAAAGAWAATRPGDPGGVVRAERLEIVELDGRLAFVLANSERPVQGTLDGMVLLRGRTEERAMPSFIFFDGRGDEVGGCSSATGSQRRGSPPRGTCRWTATSRTRRSSSSTGRILAEPAPD